MVDTVTSRTLFNNERNLIMQFTNISDATGEAAVTKVDISTLDALIQSVKIDKIIGTCAGMSVHMLWDADTDDTAFVLGAGFEGEVCFQSIGGLTNPKSTGWTGDLLFTTVGAAANDTYSLILCMSKIK